MRSIAFKLIVAFLVVSLVGTVLLALVVGRMTASEFGSYVTAQEEEDLALRLADFYAQQGSWDGVATLLSGGQGAIGPGAGRGPGAGQGRGPGRNRVTLLDDTGTVVVGGMGYDAGEQLPPGVRLSGAPVIVDGEQVGTVIHARGAPAITAAGTAFLERVNLMLIVAAVGATVVALLLGALLASTLTRPLRELTAATNAVAQGEFGRAVQVRSQDELGDLASAFNQMSGDLARAQERRQQMTADIAHDLRTPVSIIQGHAEALRDGVLPANEETFALIHDEALRLNRMVEDLRTLSRAEAGELELLKRPVQVERWLLGVVEAHKPRAAQRDVRLEAQIDGEGTVLIDADRVTQVLNNLLDNALRHTPAGGTISAGVRRQGAEIVLFVRDSGPGIASQDLPHLFERFYRGDKSRQRHGGGSGLGLAIARSIVEMHGGRIWAESNVEAGATFYISLPAHGDGA